MSDWPPGTIVVCVDASNHGDTPSGLTEGAYYTIRKIQPRFEFNGAVDTAVWLSECIRTGKPVWGSYPDCPYGGFRFRKAESTHSEAATAQAMRQVRA